MESINTTLKKGMAGDKVQHLQMVLAGFRGTVPDGIFGPGTELQVVAFQRDFMHIIQPDGIAGPKTITSLHDFAGRYPLSWDNLRCPCGVCDGFGNNHGWGEYRDKYPKVEKYYQYEYPGIHIMVLWAVKAATHYFKASRFGALSISSGYRCSTRNRQTKRKTTNHFGKAIDSNLSLVDRTTKGKERKALYEEARGLLVEKSNAQIGWLAKGRKSLEPGSIAPTWIHYDVRSYMYMADRLFVTSEKDLIDF